MERIKIKDGTTWPDPSGEAHWKSRFTLEQIQEIRAAEGEASCAELAKHYECSEENIYSIWNHRTWKGAEEE